MGNELDITYIRSIYERMTDSELMHTATQNASGLSTEALQVIRDEVERRGLDKNVLRALDAQNRTYTTEEIDRYSELLRGLHCPECGKAHDRLNGTMTYNVVSFIVFTTYTKKIVIACPSCLDSVNTNSNLMTLLLGWWGFPWGPIRTIQAVVNNIKSRKSHSDQAPNFYLRSFTAYKVGVIETYKDDKAKLHQLIAAKE